MNVIDNQSLYGLGSSKRDYDAADLTIIRDENDVSQELVQEDTIQALPMKEVSPQFDYELESNVLLKNSMDSFKSIPYSPLSPLKRRLGTDNVTFDLTSAQMAE